VEPQTIVIKIGGRMANNDALLTAFITELAGKTARNRFIIVHGGGKEVTELSETLTGKPAVFENGIRLTSPEEMEVVEMVLSGRVNKRLSRKFQANGIRAVGISLADGHTSHGEPLSGPHTTRTGEVHTVDTALIRLLVTHGFVPVFSPVSMEETGDALNINADEAALALAVALQAHTLLYLSDIPGVMKDKEVLSTLNPRKAEEEITAGVINGGMIPKVRSAIGALFKGVTRIIIGEYARAGSLEELFTGRAGTSITF